MAAVATVTPVIAAEEARYSRVAILLHWSIALLVLANLPLGLLHDWIERNFTSLMWIHKSIGMTILLLTVGRIGWRLTHRPPPFPRHLRRWERTAARTVHLGFYLLLLALPVTGLIRSSAGPYPLHWFALFDVPKLPVAEGGALARFAASAHDWMGWTMAALAALHIAAALRHHFLLRDRVLRRMIL